MGKIHEIKKARDEALAHARSIHDTATANENREASEKVEALQKELTEHITDGANPCPICGSKPLGIEQPTGRGFEYEVGCPVCPPLIHEDNSIRVPLVRGGMIPRHAVEMWNMGVDFWQTVQPHKAQEALDKIASYKAMEEARKLRESDELLTQKRAAQIASAEAAKGTVS